MHPRIEYSSAPTEGRHAAICHGLCPVPCLVFLVAAVLCIMAPVGRWDAVRQHCWAPLPKRSRCLKLHPEILDFSSTELGPRGVGSYLEKCWKFPIGFSMTQCLSEGKENTTLNGRMGSMQLLLLKVSLQVSKGCFFFFPRMFFPFYFLLTKILLLVSFLLLVLHSLNDHSLRQCLCLH